MGKYKYLFVNTGLFLLNSVTTKLIAFILVPLYTAYMSAGEYGLTDLANTVISLVIPLVTLDIADAVIRFTIGDKDVESIYAAISFAITAASIGVIACLSPFLDLEVFGGLGAYKAWFIANYAAMAFSNLCGNVARAAGRIKIIPLSAAISSFTTLFCALVFISSMGMGVEGYFISVTAGSLISICLYLSVGRIDDMVFHGTRAIILREGPEINTTIISMLRYSIPLIPNSLFWWASTSLSRFFVTGMLGISSSGMFAAASKIPSFVNTSYGIFQQAWQLSAYKESNTSTIADFYSKIFKAVSALLTSLSALLALFAPLLALVLLKGETYESWSMISPLLLANLLNVFNAFYGTIYTSTMRTGYIMQSAIIGILVCAVSTPLFISLMGVYGACVASIISQGAVFILRAINSRQIISFDAGWGTLIPTFVLLVIQCVVSAVSYYKLWLVSLFCCLAVLVIQGKGLYALLLPILNRRG